MNYNGDNNYYPKKREKISYQVSSNNYYGELRENTCKVLEKSQDDFEKYLNIFGSGGLLVGLSILSKLVDSKIVYELQWLLICGTIAFVWCLLSNLASHHMAVLFNYRTITDIDSCHKETESRFKNRNKTIGIINNISLGSLISGTILITLFLILNINTMAKQQNPQPTAPTRPSNPPTREGDNKGRVTTPPPTQRPPVKP